MGLNHEHELDVHLQNVLIRLSTNFDQLSVDQIHEKYGHPRTVTVTREDGKPLLPNTPPVAVRPLYLGKRAQEFNPSDVHVVLSDFGEAFAPASDFRRGERCATPLAFKPPEARFEPHAALSYSADIWSLATAIWQIIGMKALFSTCWVTEDEMVSQHIDVLGPMPAKWWERWEERAQFYDKDDRPIPRHMAFNRPGV